MLKIIILIGLLCSFLWQSVAFSKCIEESIGEIAKESSLIVWGEVVSSNYTPSFFEKYFVATELGHSDHKFNIKVYDVLKGAIGSKDLEFSYPYIEGQKESQRLFEVGEKVVLMIKSVDGKKANLLGEYCDRWGFEAKNFQVGSSKREEFMRLLKAR